MYPKNGNHTKHGFVDVDKEPYVMSVDLKYKMMMV